jgi:uncharacterized membrane protein YeaQ/YmgE (transglycosylase-associated protein family)
MPRAAHPLPVPEKILRDRPGVAVRCSPPGAEKEFAMGILSWLLLGLIVGALAKWIMPGDDPGGIFVTILIGIAGAFVGGFLATQLGLGTVSGFNIGSLAIAIGGSLLLLFGYRKLKT